jgi:hypothetical protein
MKAMSYLAWVDKQGLYGRRPNVEMPENTESAWSRSIIVFVLRYPD